MDKVIQFYIAYTNLLNIVKDNRLSAKGNGRNYLYSENYQACFTCLYRESKKKKRHYVIHQSTHRDYISKPFYIEQMELDF